jgi:hypothetical protein
LTEKNLTQDQQSDAAKPSRHTYLHSIPLLTVVMVTVLSTPAEAYVDPGSGSMLVQLLLGGLMAALVMARTWWHRIRDWVFGRPASEEK